MEAHKVGDNQSNLDVCIWNHLSTVWKFQVKSIFYNIVRIFKMTIGNKMTMRKGSNKPESSASLCFIDSFSQIALSRFTVGVRVADCLRHNRRDNSNYPRSAAQRTASWWTIVQIDTKHGAKPGASMRLSNRSKSKAVVESYLFFWGTSLSSSGCASLLGWTPKISGLCSSSAWRNDLRKEYRSTCNIIVTHVCFQRCCRLSNRSAFHALTNWGTNRQISKTLDNKVDSPIKKKNFCVIEWLGIYLMRKGQFKAPC